MVGSGEHEPDACFCDTAGDLLRAELDPSAERLQHISATGLARCRPISVFGYHNAGPTRHERGRRGDVYGPLRVATSAAGVEDALRSLDLCGEAAHSAGEAHDLGHCLPPDAQRGKERGSGRRGSITFHDGLERAFRLALGQDLPTGGSTKGLAQQGSGSEPQEVLQEVVTAAGQDALGVELDTLDGVLAVPDAHDRTVFGAAGDDEAFWDRPWFDHERMVARRLEALGKAFVDPSAVVHYPRRLAVDGLAAHYLGAESLPDGLVAEADAQSGDTLTDLVVAPHEDFGPELPKVLDQVVRKGVVVVYNEDPHKWSDFSG